MRVNHHFSRTLSAAAIAALALASLTVAQAAQRNGSQKARISNFGCINETFYRGAQPKGRDYDDLAAMGVKTVIDLQEDGERDEQQMVEGAGMKFYRIGLSDSSWPSRDKPEQFLKIVNDPSNQPVFVHCHGGRHRAAEDRQGQDGGEDLRERLAHGIRAHFTRRASGCSRNVPTDNGARVPGLCRPHCRWTDSSLSDGLHRMAGAHFALPWRRADAPTC